MDRLRNRPIIYWLIKSLILACGQIENDEIILRVIGFGKAAIWRGYLVRTLSISRIYSCGSHNLRICTTLNYTFVQSCVAEHQIVESMHTEILYSGKFSPPESIFLLMCPENLMKLKILGCTINIHCCRTRIDTEYLRPWATILILARFWGLLASSYAVTVNIINLSLLFAGDQYCFSFPTKSNWRSS